MQTYCHNDEDGGVFCELYDGDEELPDRIRSCREFTKIQAYDSEKDGSLLFEVGINDFAFVRIGEVGTRPAVAQILKFERRWNDDIALFRLFLRPDQFERQFHRRPPYEYLNRDELIATDIVEEYDLAAIRGRAQVLSFVQYQKGGLKGIGTQSPYVYFCRRYFRSSSETWSNNLNFETLKRKRWSSVGQVENADEKRDDESKDDEDSEWEPDDVEMGRKKCPSSRNNKSRVTGAGKSNCASVYTYQFLLPEAKVNPGIKSTVGSSEVGKPLMCRDKEKDTIRQFISTVISGLSGTSRSLYIAGVPGTGKSATVREIMNEFDDMRRRGMCAPHRVVEINGMTIPKPETSYLMLYNALKGSMKTSSHDLSTAEAKEFLMEFYTKLKTKSVNEAGKMKDSHQPTVVVFDEMDALASRSDEIMYTFAEWTTYANSKLSIVGIANTMDLPERLLARIGSRLGLNRLSYAPYNKQQLMLILENEIPDMISKYLAKCELSKPTISFEKISMELCAGKVAVISGDVRRALQLCELSISVALEAQESSQLAIVSPDQVIRILPQHVNKAASRILDTGIMIALKELSELDRMVLITIADLTLRRASFDDDISTQKLESRLKAIAGSIAQKRRFADLTKPLDVPESLKATDDAKTLVQRSSNESAKDPNHGRGKIALMTNPPSGLTYSRIELHAACEHLAAERLILVAFSFSQPSFTLNVQLDDVAFAYANEPELAAFLQPQGAS